LGRLNQDSLRSIRRWIVSFHRPLLTENQTTSRHVILVHCIGSCQRTVAEAENRRIELAIVLGGDSADGLWQSYEVIATGVQVYNSQLRKTIPALTNHKLIRKRLHGADFDVCACVQENAPI